MLGFLKPSLSRLLYTLPVRCHLQFLEPGLLLSPAHFLPSGPHSRNRDAAPGKRQGLLPLVGIGKGQGLESRGGLLLLVARFGLCAVKGVLILAGAKPAR